MGNFYKICAASKQVILPGTAIRLAVIRQQTSMHPVTLKHGDAEGKCYGYRNSSFTSDGMWAPTTFFLEGSCDDDGQLVLRFTSHTQEILRAFMKELLAAPTAVPPYDKQSFDLRAFLQSGPEAVPQWLSDGVFHKGLETHLQSVWTYISQAERDGLLFAVKPGRGVRPHAFFFMAEQAWQQLLRWSRKPGSLDKTITERISEAILFAKELPEFGEGGPGRAKAYAAAIHHVLGVNRLDEWKMFVSRNLGEQLQNVLHSNVAPQELELIVAPVLRDYMMLHSLESLGIPLFPTMTGNPYYDEDQGSEYARFIVHTHKDVEKANSLEAIGPQRYVQVRTSELLEEMDLRAYARVRDHTLRMPFRQPSKDGLYLLTLQTLMTAEQVDLFLKSKFSSAYEPNSAKEIDPFMI
ncbi:hypothetical protein LC612_41605 [Nostoc sp. CHAB 5834]|nr:hypothetical protein [Nostoc sp. CHAB 5834]